MTKVVSMARTSEYWVMRAKKHRYAGRYDDAMTLLSKARDQFGMDEAIEWEMALNYDEMSCEDEAARSYLRVARMKGEKCAEAWFNLALSSAQKADLSRAQSYFEQFERSSRRGISPEISSLMKRQLAEAAQQSTAQTRKQRAKQLEQRAATRLQEGKIYAARRTMLHAVDLEENAQRLTLLACCEMMQGKLDEALLHAEKAHTLAPRRIQTLCVWVDLLYTTQQIQKGRRMLYIAALRAQNAEEMFSVAVESAKHGEEQMTLRLTRSVLNREPYMTRAMMLRACALMNLKKTDKAKRLFARLCTLLPEDTVCAFYYAQARSGEVFPERLSLGMDVPQMEAVRRGVSLISALYECIEMKKQYEEAQCHELCRLSAWAVHSAIAGHQAAVAGILLMNTLKTDEARAVLMDALTDPHVNVQLKYIILQVLTEEEGFVPYLVDIGNGLVELAASAVTSFPEYEEEAQAIVQNVADKLMPDFPQAPKKLLPIYLAYLENYGAPKGREKAACMTALEYVFHHLEKRHVKLQAIAERNGVSVRLCRRMVQRMIKSVHFVNTKGST